MNVSETTYKRPPKLALRKNATDLSGHVYDQVTVLYPAGRAGPVENPRQHLTWLCKCACGVEFKARAPALKTGIVTSCGKCGSYINPRAMDFFEYLSQEPEETPEIEEKEAEKVLDDALEDAFGIPEGEEFDTPVETSFLDAEARLMENCVEMFNAVSSTQARRMLEYLYTRFVEDANVAEQKDLFRD